MTVLGPQPCQSCGSPTGRYVEPGRTKNGIVCDDCLRRTFETDDVWDWMKVLVNRPDRLVIRFGREDGTEQTLAWPPEGEDVA